MRSRPGKCNFISSIFLQFSDESHISSPNLIDQKLRAEEINAQLPHRNFASNPKLMKQRGNAHGFVSFSPAPPKKCILFPMTGDPLHGQCFLKT